MLGFFQICGVMEEVVGLMTGPYIASKLTAAPVELARLEVGWAQPQLTLSVGSPI